MNDSLSQCERFESEWRFAAPPERVWPLLADTNRLNQVMGLPPVRYTDAPDPRGGIRRQGQFSLHGLPMKWEEQPYEWIEGREFGVRRRYLGGPMATFALRAVLLPDGAGTRVQLRLEFEPRTAALRPLVRIAGRGVFKGFERALRRFRDYFEGKVTEPYALPVPPLSDIQQARVRTIAGRLAKLGLSP
ncbi:MAG TPA: SRPBCC family protein, partial [Stenomitos sp.]